MFNLLRDQAIVPLAAVTVDVMHVSRKLISV